ncbi:hypothetical protein [Cupriavidus sp. L7L]|uniref:hypothetical protein n=1 Tax=Cupriavidus sp. L7L TaxID=2546443 RepID=UPI00140525F6|nr:hypothetical protein [Cupriavidus sp. L7L]
MHLQAAASELPPTRLPLNRFGTTFVPDQTKSVAAPSTISQVKSRLGFYPH